MTPNAQARLRAKRWRSLGCEHAAPGVSRTRIGKATRRTKVERMLERLEVPTAKKIYAALAKSRKRIVEQVREGYARHIEPRLKTGKLAKDLTPRQKSEIDDLIAQINADGVGLAVKEALGADLEAIFREAGLIGISEVGFDSTDAIVNHVDVAAVDYAARRGGELVTGISKSTRDEIRDLVTDGVEEGWSAQTLAGELEDATAFSEYRSMMIARTELAFAHVQGNLEGWRTTGMVEGKAWLASQDACDICDALDGDEVGIDEAFDFDGESIDGPPGHPHCLPGDCLVATSSKITAASDRRYHGQLVIVRTATGKEISCTPNHPVLTNRGWVAARLLNEGDKVIVSTKWETVGNDHGYDMPARIQEVAESFGRACQMPSRKVPLAAEDFHGDGIAGDVAVIYSDRLLLDDSGHAARPQRINDDILKSARVQSFTLDSYSALRHFLKRLLTTAHGFMRLGQLSLSLFARHLFPLQRFSFASTTPFNASRKEPFLDRVPVNAESMSEHVLAFPFDVSIDDVTFVGRREFDGHVYNLETKSEFYIANGIVTHNCRCDVLPVLKPEEEEA